MCCFVRWGQGYVITWSIWAIKRQVQPNKSKALWCPRSQSSSWVRVRRGQVSGLPFDCYWNSMCQCLLYYSWYSVPILKLCILLNGCKFSGQILERMSYLLIKSRNRIHLPDPGDACTYSEILKVNLGMEFWLLKCHLFKPEQSSMEDVWTKKHEDQIEGSLSSQWCFHVSIFLQNWKFFLTNL